MQLLAVGNRRRIIVCGLALVWLLGCSFSFRQENVDTIERFKKLYGNLRDYKEFRLLTLNGHHCILAFWYEDNSPLQLVVQVFKYKDDKLEKPVEKIYEGSVAEEVIKIATADLLGSGHDQLIFLSRAGQIQILRVLAEKGNSLVPIFETGGTEITIIKPTSEIWVKSKTAGEVDIFRWDAKSSKFFKVRTEKVIL